MVRADTIYLLVLITWYILFVIFMIFLYLKYSKPYRVKNIEKYYKDIPEDLSPVELNMLIYHKITPSALSATICFFIEKGIIIREGNLLKNNSGGELLSVSQTHALELFFDVLGNGKVVDVNKIANFCDNKSSATDYLMAYDLWANMALREASSKQFFVQKMDYELVRWFQLIGYGLTIVNLIFRFHYISGYIILIPAYAILQYFYKIYKRTREYNKEFYKWLGVGNYLSSITSAKELKINPNSALIYSILLDKTEHVEKVVNNENFLTKLDEDLRRCSNKAIWHGKKKVI